MGIWFQKNLLGHEIEEKKIEKKRRSGRIWRKFEVCTYFKLNLKLI